MIWFDLYPVTTEHHFKDERLLYEFHPELGRLKVIDLLQLDIRPRSLPLDSSMLSQKQKLQANTRPSPSKSPPVVDVQMITPAPPTFFLGSPEPDDILNLAMSGRRGLSESDSDDLSITIEDNHVSPCQNPTVAMLLEPESPYVKRTIKVNLPRIWNQWSIYDVICDITYITKEPQKRHKMYTGLWQETIKSDILRCQQKSSY